MGNNFPKKLLKAQLLLRGQSETLNLKEIIIMWHLLWLSWYHFWPYHSAIISPSSGTGLKFGSRPPPPPSLFCIIPAQLNDSIRGITSLASANGADNCQEHMMLVKLNSHTGAPQWQLYFWRRDITPSSDGGVFLEMVSKQGTGLGSSDQLQRGGHSDGSSLVSDNNWI